MLQIYSLLKEIEEDLSKQKFTRLNAYPPVNLVKTGEFDFYYEFAVAGLNKDNIKLEVKDDTLFVSYTRSGEDTPNILYRGIADRNFSNKYPLPEFSVPSKTELKDGLLSVYFSINIPEERKPKVLTIDYKS